MILVKRPVNHRKYSWIAHQLQVGTSLGRRHNYGLHNGLWIPYNGLRIPYNGLRTPYNRSWIYRKK